MGIAAGVVLKNHAGVPRAEIGIVDADVVGGLDGNAVAVGAACDDVEVTKLNVSPGPAPAPPMNRLRRSPSGIHWQW